MEGLGAPAGPPRGRASQTPERVSSANRTHPLPREGGWGEGTPVSALSKTPNLDDLRRYAIARSLFAPLGLSAALNRLGFVQADPIRAPARAQDLILRHRVKGYAAGELEGRYPRLAVEEDFFINYGFLPREIQALMHPRVALNPWTPAQGKRAREVLAFVRERGPTHPRDVDAHFQHGEVRNWFGGKSKASTLLLDGMHYRGLLRVARRDAGTRVYQAAPPWPQAADPAEQQARLDRLVDLAVAHYAPLPAASLAQLVGMLRGAAPQWADDRRRALTAAKARLAQARIDGVDWFWPAGERPQRAVEQTSALRLLAPFDPVVWDRRRFELFWGWAYRFEAYTPAAKRQLGYYALPLLVGSRVLGWATLTLAEGQLRCEAGLVNGA
ncbi:MAG: winged helix-turn-helix domain-containing protein, partial [Burkholderiales bacterium]